MKRVYYEAYTDAGTITDDIVVDDGISFDELERRIENAVVNSIAIIKEEPADKVWGR